MPLVCVRVDASGTWPMLLDEGDELTCGEGVEWRFVAAAEDPEEGQRLVRQLRFEHAHKRAGFARQGR